MVEFYVAQEAGFLATAGLEPDVNYAQNGAVATQLVASDHGDVGLITLEPYVASFDKGMGGKFIATIGDQNLFYVGVPVDSDITTFAQLEGKTIGVLSMGSSSIYYAKAMAKEAGFTLADTSFAPVGMGDSALNALRTNQVQALALHRPAFAALERSGFAFRYFKDDAISGFSNYGLFVSDATLAGQRDKLVRFLGAMLKAELFVKTNPEAALRIYWKIQPEARPAGDEAAAVEVGLSELNFELDNASGNERIRPFDADRTQGLLDVLKSEGVASASITVSDIVDGSLFAEAAALVDRDAVVQLATDWKN
ncbi:hypothetical protein BES08_14170 [Novosphingobium resinovorum]|uniref:Thiamine pyrimidine synthase n=2 Tax=Novosphingobium resinovorum TaxID=158500 RepID=A0A1D8A6M8_9SPHN|nr:hypothetical protein BES08_14170 [Novosphingobium resinovorum]